MHCTRSRLARGLEVGNHSYRLGECCRYHACVLARSQMSRIHLESIEIFDELPGKCGCPTDLLDEIESSLGGLLPPLYRRLMLSDAQRMANTLHLVHPSRLTEERMVIDNLLADEQETYTFRLDQTQLVVAHG